MARDTEDKTPETAKIGDNEEEKNDKTLSRSSSTYTFEINDSEYENSTLDSKARTKDCRNEDRNNQPRNKQLKRFSRPSQTKKQMEN